MTAPFRTRLYDRYGETCGAAESGDVSRTPYLRQLVQRHFPTDRSAVIVDIGCGDGLLVHIATRAGYENVSGIDHSDQQVARAHKRGIRNVRVGDGVAALATIPTNSTDVVLTMDVLEHLMRQELMGVVDSIKRVLKPTGRWIIHVPNGESPFVGRVRYGDLTHEQAFTRMSLRQLVVSSGFSRIECYEDKPIVHGAKSALRFAAWSGIRALMRFYIAAETGTTDPNSIFSQNLLAIVFP